MNTIVEEIMVKWNNFEKIFHPVIKNLDPSLFQNIILGILAIFIPFAIVFYTNILDSKKKRSEFEKMVLSDEVLGTKTIFWFSIFVIMFFSFFSGNDVSFNAKISAIIFLVISIIILWKPFKKILIFSEGKKTEFELSFLKKIKLTHSTYYITETVRQQAVLSVRLILPTVTIVYIFSCVKVVNNH